MLKSKDLSNWVIILSESLGRVFYHKLNEIIMNTVFSKTNLV